MSESHGRKSVQDWFDEYGVSHTNPVNKIVHFVCIPLIMLSVIGLLWSIPVPAAIRSLPIPFNWAIGFLAGALAYYAMLSLSLMAGMVPVALSLGAVVFLIDRMPDVGLWQVSIAVFVVGWVGQFIGHKIEGAKPSFMKDLQFLLIGPLWILAFVYRRLGIQY